MPHELLHMANPAVLTMSSREIAQLVDTSHDSVLKTVRSLIDRGLVLKNETPYTHPQNHQTYFEFQLSYRDTMVVISGYSAEFRARVIDRWLELEHQHPAVPKNLPDALRLAADLAEQKAQAEAALALAAPKAAALDRIATETGGAVCLRVAAKLLQMPEKQFLKYAHVKGFIFRGSHGTWQSYAEKRVRGLLEQKLTKVRCTDGSDRTVEQVLVTKAGLAKFAEMLANDQLKPAVVPHA